MATTYPDGRPNTQQRLEARDHGIVLRHGDACDCFGARDVWVWEDAGTLHMHYDAASEAGWLCALATSHDGLHWQKHGTVLELGAAGSFDAASASYGVTCKDGDTWHMYYLGTPNVTEPGKVPAFPYRTLHAKSNSATGPWQKTPGLVALETVPNTFYAVTASPGQIFKQGQAFCMIFSAAMLNAAGQTLRTLGLAQTQDLEQPWQVRPEPLLPITEQIENASLYFEPSSNLWFLFTNHVGVRMGVSREQTPLPVEPNNPVEFTDAIWVYWSPDPTRFDAAHKAVVLDATNCTWSTNIIGLPSVVQLEGRLAIFYDGTSNNDLYHLHRDVGVAFLDLPLKVGHAF